MNPRTAPTPSLPIVGGTNRALVAPAKLDLVARLTGNECGETDAAGRVVPGAVGRCVGVGRRPADERHLVTCATRSADARCTVVPA